MTTHKTIKTNRDGIAAANQHTPGPWTATHFHETCSDPAVVTGPHGVPVADIPLSYGHHNANARLIAAAPELLQIAIAYRNLLRSMAHTEGEVATFHHIVETIAKATGGGK